MPLPALPGPSLYHFLCRILWLLSALMLLCLSSRDLVGSCSFLRPPWSGSSQKQSGAVLQVKVASGDGGQEGKATRWSDSYRGGPLQAHLERLETGGVHASALPCLWADSRLFYTKLQLGGDSGLASQRASRPAASGQALVGRERGSSQDTRRAGANAYLPPRSQPAPASPNGAS